MPFICFQSKVDRLYNAAIAATNANGKAIYNQIVNPPADVGAAAPSLPSALIPNVFQDKTKHSYFSLVWTASLWRCKTFKPLTWKGTALNIGLTALTILGCIAMFFIEGTVGFVIKFFYNRYVDNHNDHVHLAKDKFNTHMSNEKQLHFNRVLAGEAQRLQREIRQLEDLLPRQEPGAGVADAPDPQSLHQRVQALRDAGAAAVRARDEHAGRIQNLERNIADLTAERERLTGQIHDKQRVLNAQAGDARTAQERLTQRLHTLETDLQAARENLEHAIAEHTAAQGESAQRIQALEADLQGVRGNLEHANAAHAAAQGESAQRIQDLEGQIQRLTAAAEEANAAHAAAQGQVDQRIQELELQTQNLEAENERLRETLQTVADERDQAVQDAHKNDALLVDLELRKTPKGFAKLEQEKAEKQAEIDALSSRVAELEQESSRLRASWVTGWFVKDHPKTA